MPREIRFAAFTRETTTHQSIISYNALVPKIETEVGIDKPHGGLVLMSRVDNFVPLILPDDIPEED